MVEATFIASGNNMKEALNFTASLVNKVIIGELGSLSSNSLDIFCSSIEDANLLNDILYKHFLPLNIF